MTCPWAQVTLHEVSWPNVAGVGRPAWPRPAGLGSTPFWLKFANVVDYDETFSPVAMLKSFRIILAIAAYFDYEIW